MDDTLQLPDQNPLPGSALHVVDPGQDALELPDQVSPLQKSFLDTRSAEPDKTARVLDLSRRLNEPEAFIDKNLDVVEKVAGEPTPDYWARLEKQYPGTARFLVKPKNMAVAKDDVETLSKIEDHVDGYSYGETLWKSLQVGMNQMDANLARLPAMGYNAAALPQNLIAKALGRPDKQVRASMDNPVSRLFEKNAQAYSTPELEQSIVGLVGNGDLKGAARALAAQLVANTPTQVPIILATMAGYGTPALLGMGSLQAASAGASSEKKGLDASNATLNAIAQGSMEALFERLGTVGILGHWEGVIAKSFGQDTAREVAVKIGKTLAYSFLGEGNEEFWTSMGQDFSDFAYGAAPSLDGILPRAANAGIVGGFSGVAMTGPGAVASGMTKARAARNRTAYQATMDDAANSKLRERAPEAFESHLEELTKDSAVKTVYIPAEEFKTYFQDKSLDPAVVAEQLGVAQEYADAAELGADVPIPMSKFATVFAGTEHAAGLRDSVKFNTEDMTPKQIQDAEDVIGQQVEQEAAKAVKEDPKVQEGRDIVFEDVKNQLLAAGRPQKEAEAAAQVWASRAVVEARRRDITPEEWYKGGNLRVTNEKAAPEPDQQTLEQQARAATETPEFKQFFDGSTVVDESGAPLVVYHGTDKNFTAFKTNQPFSDGESGAFFTASPKVAKGYAKGKGGNIKPVFLSIKNPYVTTAKAWADGESMSPDGVKLEGEHDGYIIRGQDGTDTFIAFEPTQIKSATGNRGTFDATDPNILRQDARPADGPIFFSGLQKTVEAKMPNRAPAEQVKNIIKESKQEELEWSGINEWLDQQKGLVEKKAVLEFLKANEVQVEEVVKGNAGTPDAIAKKIEDLKKEKERVIDEGTRGLADNDRAPQDVIDAATEIQDQIIALQDSLSRGGDTTFSKYTIPGGENYRELLLTLPTKESDRQLNWTEEKNGDINATLGERSFTITPEGSKFYVYERGGALGQTQPTVEDAKRVAQTYANKGKSSAEFRSSHFDEPNVLAHVRFNERMDADGKRVLFIEEVQSDWHQIGRDLGYKGTLEGAKKHFGIEDDVWAKMDDEQRQSYVEEMAGQRTSAPPDAPFKKTWHELALKRMLRWAVDNGFDRLAWTTGEQQAERYDLSKQISRVLYFEGELTAWDLNDNAVLTRDNVPQDKLADYIGKEGAQKLIEMKPDAKGYRELKGVDLKVGGEGMKGFYDQILPSFLNKYTKKWGGRVGTTTIKQDTHSFTIEETPAIASERMVFTVLHGGVSVEGLHDFRTRKAAEKWIEANKGKNEAGATVHALDITPAMKDAAAAGQPLFQDPTDPRGFIQFTPRETLIALVKADASTFMHESAHFWLKDLFDYVRGGKATPQVSEDWAKLADWLGVKEGQAELTREQQEKFARGFEAYLRDGKAPAAGLKGAFRLFRRWLGKLYRDVKSLNVEMSDDIKGVFDRMIASEDEIAFAWQTLGYEQPAPIEGLAPEVQARLQELQERARDEAVDRLLARQMKELTKEHREQLAKDRQDAENRITAEVEQLPEYRAIESIRRTFKKGAIVPKAEDIAQRYLDDKLTDGQDQSFDMLADMSGFGSGDEMAKKVLAARPLAEEVAARVNVEMEKFADLKDTVAIREEALRAVHNDFQEDLLAMERGLFLDMVGNAQSQHVLGVGRRAQAKIEADAARRKAAAVIASKPVKDAGNYMPFFTAERNAAAGAAKALAAKDFEKAANFKRQQMLNHALAREAFKVRAEIDKAMKLFKKYAQRGQDLKDMPYGFIRQIDKLLGDHGLAEPPVEDAGMFQAMAMEMAKNREEADVIANATGLVRDGQGWRGETLSETVQRIADNYYTLALPDEILNAKPQPYRDLSLSSFRSLKGAVEALGNIGRTYERFLSAFITADLRTAGQQAAASMSEKVGDPYELQRELGRQGSKAKDLLEWISIQPGDKLFGGFDLVNLLTLTKFLDGGADDGPMQSYVYRVLTEAENKKIALTREMVQEVNGLIDKHFTPKEFKDLREKRIHFDFLPSEKPYLTREEMLSIALNWGNEGNRDRIRRGYALNDDQVQRIIDHLSEREIRFAQGVFDHLETYWPQVAALEMKVAGLQPEKVDHTQIRTLHGDFAGGYYPLAYDFEKSAEAYKHAEQRNALYKQFSATSAHTLHGHTKARVDTLNRPVRLSLDVLFNHMENLVHDLAFREAVIDVNRFLKQRAVAGGIANAIGPKGQRVINDALKAVASDQGEFLDGIEKAVRWIRFGGTMSRLGLRLFTFPMDLTGNLINGVAEIGAKRLTQSMVDFAMNPADTVAFVNSQSERMKQRATLRDRDLKNLADRWHGKEGFAKQTFFLTMALADEAVSYPVWNEVYNHQLPALGADKARQIADETVTRTFGSGSIIDQAAIQRGNEYKKIWTWWYSWMGMMFNRAWLSGKIAGLEYDKGNVGAAAGIIAKTFVFAWLLQAANENFWRELFRNAPDGGDDEKRKKRVLSRFLSQGFGYIPFVRDVAGYAIGRAQGGQADLKIPLASTIETIVNPLADLAGAAFSDKELGERFPEQAASAVSLMLGVPQQINAWVFNFIDWLRDEGEPSWRDLLTRRVKS